MSELTFFKTDMRYDGIEKLYPLDIEKKSMETIQHILDEQKITLDEKNADVIKRCIHTSADFDYVKNLIFSKDSVDILRTLLQNNAVIVTDTNMAYSGISSAFCKKLGIEKHCFISDEDVVKTAKENGVTRAIVSIDKAASLYKDGKRPVVFAIGNAPTSLVRIRELCDSGIFVPDFVIGVPVGFVNVVRAKELIIESDIPHIVAKGRKGGSNIAAAIVNATLYSLGERQ